MRGSIWKEGGDVIVTTKELVEINLVLKESLYKTLEKVSKSEGRSVDAKLDNILYEHFDDERGDGE